MRGFSIRPFCSSILLDRRPGDGRLHGRTGCRVGQAVPDRHRDPVGPLRRPAHLRTRPPESVPGLRLRTDGGALGAVDSSVRAGPRARGGVLRPAVSRFRSLGAHQRAARHREEVGGRAEPRVRAAHRGIHQGPERLGQRASGGPQPRSQGRAAAHRRGCLRAWPARDSLRLDCQPAAARGPARPLRRRGARLQRMGHRRRPLGHRQGHSDEQFAPAMGRHPHLLRGAAHRARGHVVRRRMGRLSSTAPVLHGVRRLDADDEQPIRVRSLQAGAEGRRLRARRPGEGVRHAHRDHQGARGQRRR